ncbi:CTD phosphatase Fcp1 [Rhizina undulata]
MIIQLPRSLRYPITIKKLLRKAEEDVPKLEPLLLYQYKTTRTEYPEYGEEVVVEVELLNQFECPVTGRLERWLVKEGQVIHSCEVDIAEIVEPCAHEMQFAGLCAQCGADMTEQDYTSFSNKSRATIQMAHDSIGLTVSQDAASRLEEETKKRLLQSRKLSLVVDLDQTIIHATVDPTVGEWMADPTCVNHDSVKDVHAFKLDEDMIGGRGTTYYVKMRPGLKDFLEKISKLYELHIYTMGTRAYAMAVKKIVDPEGKIFGERVLSRDESGSMTQKSLHRLFPVDTKMVVIIDDRGDVWKWCENLVKVKPYDFFVGIGDINSSFLPKRQEFPTGPPVNPTPTPAITETSAIEQIETTEEDAAAENIPPEELTTESTSTSSSGAQLSTLEQLVTMGAGDDQNLLNVQSEELDKAITAQKEARPLAKKQELQDKLDDKAAEIAATTESTDGQNGHDMTPSEASRQRHSVLHDNDIELTALTRNLTDVHSVFYEEYEKNRRGRRDRVAQLKRPRVDKKPVSEDALDLNAVPDITAIMPTMKRRALTGTVLVFSGVIPLGADVQSSDIAVWAKSFGAFVSEIVTSRVTHVIAARSRTAKVRQAARHPRIKIVSPQWLYDSMSNWRKELEDPYLIQIHPEDRPSSLNGLEGEAALDGPVLSSEDEEITDLDDLDDDDVPSSQNSEASSNSMMKLSNVHWDEVDQELNDFLGEDDDSDAESTASASTIRSTSSVVVGSKRSRSLSPMNSDDEAGLSAEDIAKSRLAKRQKLARERPASGLRSVEIVEVDEQGEHALEPASHASNPEPEEERENSNTEEDMEDDDAFAAELEKELLASSDEDEEVEENVENDGGGGSGGKDEA